MCKAEYSDLHLRGETLLIRGERNILVKNFRFKISLTLMAFNDTINFFRCYDRFADCKTVTHHISVGGWHGGKFDPEDTAGFP